MTMDMGLSSAGKLQKLGSIKVPDYFYDRMQFSTPIMNEIINGDGLVKGQAITLAAPKGSGKTTLLLQLCESFIKNNPGVKAAYLSGEECVEQLAFTSQRINTPSVLADNVTDVDTIANIIKDHDLVVIDSVQSLTHPELTGKRLEEYACSTLIKVAKAHECAVIFILHFTKAGVEKGTSLFPHSVDTCIKIHKMDIEDFGENARMIEVEKNRFGCSAEIMLRITEAGFDWEDPISKKVAPSSLQNTNRAALKASQYKALIEEVQKNSPDNTSWKQFLDAKICEDVGRLERLIKDLEKSGQLIRIGGRGTEKYWTIGDVIRDDN